MTMKRYASLCAVIMLCAAVMAGCGSGEQVSSPTSASSMPPESETSASVSSPVSSSEPPSSSEKPVVSSEPEPVKKSINFAEMDKEELIEVLQPVLDKAWVLCTYGYYDRFNDQTKPSITFNRSSYYPVENLPYANLDEMKQDMLTVFPQEILDTQLGYICESENAGYKDFDGKLYVTSNGGYSKGRKWNAETIEVLDATPGTLTALMELNFMGDIFIAPITFKYVDGNIILGENFFANMETVS